MKTSRHAIQRPIWPSTALTAKSTLRVFWSNVKELLNVWFTKLEASQWLKAEVAVVVNKSLRNISGFGGLARKSKMSSFEHKQGIDWKMQSCDKTKNLGLDWSHTEKSSWQCSQEDNGVQPLREAHGKAELSPPGCT